MTTRSWLRNLFARSTTRTIRKAPRRARLAVEALEDRAVPATFTVLNTLDDGSVGSLRWAVGQANGGGTNTIAFDSAVFAVASTITLGGTQLELRDTTGTETITGPAAGVTVSGAGLSRVFQVDRGVTASISGLTITGGNSGVGAGGGLVNSGTLTMTNCTVSGNTTTGGFGGGLFTSGTATLTNCTISENNAQTIHSNGGGVENTGTVTLTNCTISGNTAGTGAGLDSWVSYGQGMATLTNCTISGNSTNQGGGGGVFNRYRSTISLTNCTVSGNSAAWGGSLVEWKPIGSGAFTIGNTIVAGTTGGLPDTYGTFVSLGNNLISKIDSTSSGWVASDIVGVAVTDIFVTDDHGNPLLADNGGPTQTVALLPGSPAIDAGTATGAPSTDQRGFGRVGAVDIGAFESNGVAPATHFMVSAPATAQAGTAFSITVTALDQYGNIATGYPGTVQFTSSDALVILPVGATLNSGTGTFTMVLRTTGNQTITATATVSGAINGTSNAVAVSAAAANQLVIGQQPSNTTVGVAFNPAVTVQIEDAFGNVVSSDNSDPITLAVATGPGSFAGGSTTTVTAVNGIATFNNLILDTAGSYTVSATASGITTSASFSLTNNPATTSTMVVSSPTPSVYGQAVTFIATVINSSSSLVPTGTVAYFDGATLLGLVLVNGLGQASLTTTALSAGSHSIQAVYNSNVNFLGSTSPNLTQIVNQATLTGDATTQDALNLAKQGKLTITVSNVSGLVGNDTLAAFLNTASYYITIGATKYEFVPTTVTTSGSSITVTYSMKDSALLAELGHALDAATSGATAVTAGFEMESTNYTFFDSYLTRMFSTAK